MIKKWLPGLIGLSIFALLGRLLGFLREILMASKFGANDITDAYLTTLLLFDIAMAANASILAGTLSFSSEVKDLKYFSKTLFLLGLKAFIIISILALLYYPFADKLIPLVFSKSPESTRIVIDASRLFFILAAFLIACGIFSALLQIKGKITNPGRLIIFLNVSSIFFLIFFSKNLGIISLSLGLLLGGILFFIYQIILIRKINTNSSENFSKRKFNMLKWGAVVSLVFMNSLMPSISGLLERYFSLLFIVGTFSHYQYAAKIILMPLTIFSFAISTSLLPIQTKSISEGNIKEFIKTSNNGILLSVITSSFFVLVFFVLAQPIIQLVYQHGHFTLKDSLETSHALQIMSIGLIPFLLNPVLANIFYSLRYVKNIIYINLFFILIQFSALLIISRISSGINSLTITWVFLGWGNNIYLLYYLFHYKKIDLDKTILVKILNTLLITVIILVAGTYTIGKSLFEVNILEDKWQSLLKVSGIGFIIFLVYAIALGIVFREKFVKILVFVKRIRK
jgi:putative peptidoglycan lipid II flippase